MAKTLDISQPQLSSLLNLEGKVAVVTGGAGWLGTSICETLAELGAKIFIASRDTSKHTNVINNIPNKPNQKIESIQFDLSSEQSVKNCFAKIIDSAGQIDILVNNAYSGPSHSFTQTGVTEWKNILDVGLTGYFMTMKEAAHHMQNVQSGVIVNIASMYGLVSPDFSIYEETEFCSSPAYGAAKAGIIQLTRYAACSLAQYNIRVNSISLGPFPAKTVQEDKMFVSRLAAKTPLGRIGSPWEIKGALAFLATQASSYVTGQNLVVDGGWTAW
jgi:NAD(P)-dependent dehydrogenase (short-subunit alcohol dehydrogenase family)